MKKIVSFIIILTLFSFKFYSQTVWFENDINNIKVKIKTKHDEYKQDSTKISLKKEIDSLTAKKDDLEIKYNEVSSLLNGDYNKEMKSLKDKIEKNDNSVVSKSSFFTLDRILTLFSLLFAFGLAFYFFLDKKNRREEILFVLTNKKKNESNLPRLETWRNELVTNVVEEVNFKSKSNNSNTNQSIENRRLQDLIDRIEKLEKNYNDFQNQQTIKNIVIEQVQNNVSILYADAIINDGFNKITLQPNDDTVFEINVNTSKVKNASFTVYKDAYKRVLKNPDFVEGCDKHKLSLSPTDLMIENGTANLSENGKWQISKKMVIKFV